jgi:hypothetical protein
VFGFVYGTTFSEPGCQSHISKHFFVCHCDSFNDELGLGHASTSTCKSLWKNLKPRSIQSDRIDSGFVVKYNFLYMSVVIIRVLIHARMFGMSRQVRLIVAKRPFLINKATREKASLSQGVFMFCTGSLILRY